jgi:predicted NBD/HSP70 family sugar kinase
VIKYTFNFTGSYIRGMRFDENDNENKEYQLAYPERIDDLHIDLEVALNLIKDVLYSDAGDTEFELGLSVPGLIDNKNLKIKTESILKNINLDIKEFFSEFKHLKKIVIQNDGKAELIGEYVYGIKGLEKSVFMISVGFAIGGAAIINGKLIEGENGYAGEYSKMLAFIDKKSNLENVSIYCGIMQARYRLAMAKKLDVKRVNWSDLVLGYENNDPDVLHILNLWTASIAKHIINLNLILDVNQVIIEGRTSSFAPFVEKIKSEMHKCSQKVKMKEPQLLVGLLKEKAACYGMLAILEGKI